MWLAGPTSDAAEEIDEWAAELETGVAGWHRTPVAAEPPAPSPPDISAYDDVDERLGAVAAEEGWDEAEVEAVRAYLSRVTPPPEDEVGATEPPPERRPSAPEPPRTADISLPGGDELADALAGLDRPTDDRGTGPAAEPDRAEDEGDLDPAPGEPEWLRGRRDAAARAYRRLRRIFPNPEDR